MPVSVHAPNGDVVDFPDGTPDATINEAMAKSYGGQTATPPAGQTTQGAGAGENVPTPQPAPENQWLGFAHGADRVLDNASVFLSHTPVIGPMIDNSMGPEHTAEAIRASHERYFADQQARGHGRPGAAGDFGGTVFAEAPLALVTRNPWVGGAMGGGLATNDPDNARGVATDTATGALGGKLFHTGTQWLANTVNPMVRGAVQRMIAAGVPVTPGQILGGSPQMIENAMRFIPGVGDLVHGAQDRSLTGFNNAAYNEALTHIGDKLPPGITGHDAAIYTQQAISNEYNRILPSLKIKYDIPFVHDIGTIWNTVQSGTLPAPKARQFMQIVQGVRNRFSGGGGMTGRTMQEVDSGLGQQYRQYKASPNPDDQNLAHHILDVQRALREMVYRANPTRRAELEGVRQAFRHFVPVEEAAGRGSTDAMGRFQPGDLKNVVAQQNSRRAVSQANAPLQGLAEDAQATMGRSIPKPNPVNRLMMAGGSLLGGLSAHINPATLLPGLGVGAPYTRLGGRLTRELLTGRQGPVYRALGTAIRRMGPVAARVGGAAAAPKYVPHASTPIEEHPEFYTGGGA